MNTINNPIRFAELEYCLQSYFDGKLVPMMKQVQDTLANKQVDEKADTRVVWRESSLLSIPMPTTPTMC